MTGSPTPLTGPLGVCFTNTRGEAPATPKAGRAGRRQKMKSTKFKAVHVTNKAHFGEVHAAGCSDLAKGEFPTKAYATPVEAQYELEGRGGRHNEADVWITAFPTIMMPCVKGAVPVAGIATVKVSASLAEVMDNYAGIGVEEADIAAVWSDLSTQLDEQNAIVAGATLAVDAAAARELVSWADSEADYAAGEMRYDYDVRDAGARLAMMRGLKGRALKALAQINEVSK